MENYTSKINGLDLELDYIIKKTEVNGTITWEDNKDQAGLRPDSFIIELFQNDKKIDELSVENDQTTYKFEDLLQEDVNFKDYEYTVKIQRILNYQTTIDSFDINLKFSSNVLDKDSTKKPSEEDNKDDKNTKDNETESSLLPSTGNNDVYTVMIAVFGLFTTIGIAIYRKVQ